MIRTFLDAGVFITAYTGDSRQSSPALTLFESGTREFVSSDLVKLEVLPQAQYHKQWLEIGFYESCFAYVSIWVPTNEALVQNAVEIAGRYGLHGMDALHVASAISAGASALITAERATKPLYRVRELRVIPLSSLR